MEEFKAVTDKVGDKIYLTLKELKRLQGDLKSIDKDSYAKFKAQILENGFISPFHVWDDNGNYCLIDGHTRLFTLLQMKHEGIHVPDKLPCIIIHAKTRQEAIKMLMGMVSQYGKATEESLSDFAITEGLSFNWIQQNTDIPNVDFTFDDPAEDKKSGPKEPKTCPHCGEVIDAT